MLTFPGKSRKYRPQLAGGKKLTGSTSFLSAKATVIYLVLGSSILAASALPALAGSEVDWDKLLEKGYHQLGIANNKEAAEIFETKVRKYPQSGACHTALGRAFKKLGKISEAKAEFRNATEVEPTFADAWYELGSALESDKQYAPAAQSFEKYLELKPDNANRRAIEDRIRFCKGQVQ